MKLISKTLLFRAPGWKFNLPGPNEPPRVHIHPSSLSNPPNHIDDIYLELPRGTYALRGTTAWIVIIVVAALIFQLGLLFSHGVKFSELSWMFIFFCATVLPCILGYYYYSWRMDTEAPKDEPIRFNRMRRKIYAYNFRSNGLKTFSREGWGINPVAYDWDNLRAEFYSVYGPMGTGGLVQNVYLAVVEPGTGKIIDRFIFAHGRHQGEMYWALAQLYMQQGPEALPNFDKKPRDWNNEYHVENIGRRMAPKVVWPDAMDSESKTAPHKTL